MRIGQAFSFPGQTTDRNVRIGQGAQQFRRPKRCPLTKGSSRVDDRELRSLNAFREEFHPPKALLVSNEAAVRKVGEIEIIPRKIFLSRLWEGSLIG